MEKASSNPVPVSTGACRAVAAVKMHASERAVALAAMPCMQRYLIGHRAAQLHVAGGPLAEKIPGTDWQEVTCDDGKKYWCVCVCAAARQPPSSRRHAFKAGAGVPDALAIYLVCVLQMRTPSCFSHLHPASVSHLRPAPAPRYNPKSEETTWHIPPEVEAQAALKLDPVKAKMLERAKAMGAQVAPEYATGGWVQCRRQPRWPPSMLQVCRQPTWGVN